MASRGDRRSRCYRMKILIDMNLSPAWVPLLEEAEAQKTAWVVREDQELYETKPVRKKLE